MKNPVVLLILFTLFSVSLHGISSVENPGRTTYVLVPPAQPSTKIAIVKTLQDLRKIKPVEHQIYSLREKGKEGNWKWDKKSIEKDNVGTVAVTKDGYRIVRIIGNNPVKYSWFISNNSIAKTVHTRTYEKTYSCLKNAVDVIVRDGNRKPLHLDDALTLDISALPVIKMGIVGKGSISWKGATIYKQGWDVVGIPQNINERVFDGKQIDIFGKLLPAPLASKPPKGKVEILAHFYNDMGLTANALSKYSYHGWYDSRMFFTNANEIDKNFEPYDPSRHPVLGWYRGDDENVLDWQCYWLVKYGVEAIVPVGVLNEKNFKDDPSSSKYWVWKLFNKVKNFKQLTYVLYLDMAKGNSVSDANHQQNYIIDAILKKHRNIYTYEVGGKRFPVFYVWDMESARGLYDNYNGSSKTVQRLKDLSDKMKGLGYDGICILARNLSIDNLTFSDSKISALEDAGCLLYSASYIKNYDSKNFKEYSDYAKLSTFPKSKREIVNILTSADSRKPHPSRMSIKNSSPEAFNHIVNRARRWVEMNGNPPIITIYNVAEWAEGGPGLQPNQRDGYGYLEAIRDAN